jgi:hypothetical protein
MVVLSDWLSWQAASRRAHSGMRALPESHADAAHQGSQDFARSINNDEDQGSCGAVCLLVYHRCVHLPIVVRTDHIQATRRVKPSPLLPPDCRHLAVSFCTIAGLQGVGTLLACRWV